MAQRQSSEERVLAYFEDEPEAKVDIMFNLIKAVVRRRFKSKTRQSKQKRSLTEVVKPDADAKVANA